MREQFYSIAYWRFHQYFSTLISIMSSTLISSISWKEHLTMQWDLFWGVNVFQLRCVFFLNISKFIMICCMKNCQIHPEIAEIKSIFHNDEWCSKHRTLYSKFFKNAYDKWMEENVNFVSKSNWRMKSNKINNVCGAEWNYDPIRISFYCHRFRFRFRVFVLYVSKKFISVLGPIIYFFSFFPSIFPQQTDFHS